MAYEKTNWTSATAINPTNLNKIENGIEQNSNDIETLNTDIDNLTSSVNELKELNIILAETSSDTRYEPDSYTIIGFDNVKYSKGDKLTLENNKIVIGSGISSIRISSFFKNSPSGDNALVQYRLKKNNEEIIKSGFSGVKAWDNFSVTFPTYIIDVNEGDTISVEMYPTTNYVNLRSKSFILIEVIG